MAQQCKALTNGGMRIAFSPAPMSADVHHYPLELVDIFVQNETEAEGLTGETDPRMCAQNASPVPSCGDRADGK